jgi:hypothetical protein
MREEDIERRLDESAARLESWYARLPLVVRVVGDIICLDLTAYIVAWIASSVGLFELSSPGTWALSTWGYIIAVSAAVCLVYELITTKRQKT